MKFHVIRNTTDRSNGVRSLTELVLREINFKVILGGSRVGKTILFKLLPTFRILAINPYVLWAREIAQNDFPNNGSSIFKHL